MKANKLVLLICITVFVYCNKGYGQTEEAKAIAVDSTLKDESRLKFGCGFGLSFVGGTNISLSPNLMYKVSEKVSIGAGIQGSYSAIKNLQNTTTFGANVISLYSPVNKI
jgi:hypothetical protein